MAPAGDYSEYVLSVLSGGLSQTFQFIYQVVDFSSGHWQTSGNPTAVSLDQNWGWTALQNSLVERSYNVLAGSPLQDVANHPTCPILGLAIHAEGGTNDQGQTVGVQGPGNTHDTTVTQESLQALGFNKQTDGLAIALFTSCGVASSPLMNFVLRNNGMNGQIPNGNPGYTFSGTTNGLR